MLAKRTTSSRRCSVAVASMVLVNESGNLSGDVSFSIARNCRDGFKVATVCLTWTGWSIASIWISRWLPSSRVIREHGPTGLQHRVNNGKFYCTWFIGLTASNASVDCISFISKTELDEFMGAKHLPLLDKYQVVAHAFSLWSHGGSFRQDQRHYPRDGFDLCIDSNGGEVSRGIPISTLEFWSSCSFYFVRFVSVYSVYRVHDILPCHCVPVPWFKVSDRARLVTRAEVFQLLLRDKCVVGLSAVTSLRSCCSQRPFAWDTEGIVQCCCFGLFVLIHPHY